MIHFPSPQLQGVICEPAFDLLSPEIQVLSVVQTMGASLGLKRESTYILGHMARELPILQRHSQRAHKYTEEHIVLVTYEVNILSCSRRDAMARGA